MANIEIPDLNEFEASSCDNTVRTIGSGGVSIIYSSNGKRISINNKALKHLSHYDSIQIAYSDNFLALSNYIGETNTSYSLRRNGNNYVIYNTQLVEEIISRYNLDFSNRTCITFPIYEVVETDMGEIVYIDINPTRIHGQNLK